MKKFLSILAAAVLSVACLAGCGDSSSTADSSKTESSSSVVESSAADSTADSGDTESSAADSSEAESSAADSSSEASQLSAVLTIDVSDINENYDSLEKGLQSEEFVPKSGKIIDAKTYEFTEGQTALDVLKKATSENNIKLDVKDSDYGPYIAGINSIYSGSCGANSGWMFKVNGNMPDVGADAYKLAAGDQVEFFYVCDYNKLYAADSQDAAA